VTKSGVSHEATNQVSTRSRETSPSHTAADQGILPSTVRIPSFRVIDAISQLSPGGRLFTLHELSSTLSVQPLPSIANANSSATPIATVSITPPNPPSGAKFGAAEIIIPPPTYRFPTPYIYVSNRNIGVQDPRGDTIAIFQHTNPGLPDEGLVLVNQVYTGINQPRGMSIGPKCVKGADEYLVTAGVAGTAGVVVFRRTEGGRNLEFVAQNTEIPTRTSFVWIEK